MATRNARVIVSAQDRASRTLLRIGNTMRGLGALAVTLGAVQIGRKMVAGVEAGVQVFREWDQQLANTAAVTGKTRQELVGLEQQSKSLGRTTAVTAKQTAEAQFLLAKAGFEVNEIYSAIPGTLDLAIAGQLSMADAADISAQALRAFGLEASAATDVADLLAKAANTANTNVQEIGEALKFASPAAKALGANLQETAAAIQIVSDRGLKGSLAGTGLAKTFSTLLGQVDKLEGATGLGGLEEKLVDSEGRFIGLAEAVRVLAENGVNARNVYKIFGERAGKVASILLANVDALEEANEALGNRRGFAKQVAEIKLQSLEGDTIKLKSAMEGLGLVVGEQLNEGLRVLAQQLTIVANLFTDSAEQGNGIAVVLSRVGEWFTRVGEIAVRVADVIQIAWRGLSVFFNALMFSMLDAVARLGEAILGLVEHVPQRLRGAFELATVGLKQQTEGVRALADGFRDNGEAAWESALDTSKALGTVQDQLRAVREEQRALQAELEEGFMGPPRHLAGGGEGGGSATPEDRAQLPMGPTPEEIEQQAEQVTAARIRALEAAAALELEHSDEQHALMMEARQLQHEEELAALGENEEAKAQLRLAYMRENVLLEQQRQDAILAGKVKAAKIEDGLEKRREQQRTDRLKSGIKQSVALMGQLFGKSRLAAIATATVNTALSVTEALKNPPGVPFTIPMGVLAAAKGLAELAVIKRQKFQYGGAVQANRVPFGLIRGGAGVDGVPISATAGELVADTTADEARRILGGRAAVVPAEALAAGGGGGGTVFNVYGDVLDPDEFFRRHAQAMGRGLAQLEDDGGLA